MREGDRIAQRGWRRGGHGRPIDPRSGNKAGKAGRLEQGCGRYRASEYSNLLAMRGKWVDGYRASIPSKGEVVVGEPSAATYKHNDKFAPTQHRRSGSEAMLQRMMSLLQSHNRVEFNSTRNFSNRSTTVAG